MDKTLLPPTDDRDITMGQYIDAWSSLEDKLFVLFFKLTKTNYDIARAIYATGIQAKNLAALLITIAPYRLTKSEQKNLKPLCKNFSTLALKRNKIIHSVWQIETKGNNYQWVRMYSPISNEDWAETLKHTPRNPHNQSVRKTNRFTIYQLAEAVKEIETLHKDFHNFIRSLIDRLPAYEG